MYRRPWNPLGAVSLMIALMSCSESAPLPTQMRPPSVATLAAQASSPSTAHTVYVTSAIANDATFQINSDGLVAYMNSSTLDSEIQGATGDWVLDSYTPRNGTRTVYLAFSRPIAGSGPGGGDPVAIPSGYYTFHMISKCHLTNNSFFAIAPGQTVQCPLHLGSIFVNGQEYGVTMNAGFTSDGDTWPETNYANVVCNSAAGSCASWTITPSAAAPDGSSANVAVLIKYVTTTIKGKTTTTRVKQGDFHMAFRIDISNP